MSLIFKHAVLLFVLLNPFLSSVYLLELIHRLNKRSFAQVLLRSTSIAGIVYVLFAIFGDKIFTDVLQVRFSSFLIFGGVVFLVAGIRFVFGGATAMHDWRGEPELVAGSIAMPFLIGPATVSACVLMGQQLDITTSALVIGGVLEAMNLSMILFKSLYDYLSKHNEKLLQRYMEITGRICALYIGAVAIDMILRGVELWLNRL